MKRARMGKGRPEWLVPLDDPRDEQILAAAFDVFADKGFHGATMLEIATRARASKKTLYERFKDKAALFRALLAWGARQNLPEVAPPDTGDPAAALEQHALTVLRAMMREESLGLFRIVAAEAARFPEIGQHFDRATRTSSAAIVHALAARLGIAPTRHEQFGEDFIALVRGETYFRVAIGALPIPPDAALKQQASHAVRTLLAAYSSKGGRR